MDKSYRTSVRRAAKRLAGLGVACESSFSLEDDELIRRHIDEVVQWLVDRDKRLTRALANLKRGRDATI